MLVIAERREISVVARPVERVAERGDEAQHEQTWTDAVHSGKQRILQSGETRAGDDQRPHAETDGERHHDRPDDEARGEDQRERGEHGSDGEPGLEQIHGEEGASAAQRDGVNAVMQVEEIDRP